MMNLPWDILQFIQDRGYPSIHTYLSLKEYNNLLSGSFLPDPNYLSITNPSLHV
jgi:hypothetical protein